MKYKSKEYIILYFLIIFIQKKRNIYIISLKKKIKSQKII